MIQANMHKILNDLKWQIEAGIDEVISDKPIVFSNEENIKENKKIKNLKFLRKIFIISNKYFIKDRFYQIFLFCQFY